MVVFQKVLKHFSKYKGLLLLFMLGIIIEIVYMMLAPLSLKYMIDLAFTPRDQHVFLIILSILLIGGFLSIIAGLFGDYAISRLSGNTIYTMRLQLFSHIQRLSQAHMTQYRVGDIVTRFSTDMNAVERMLMGSLPFGLKEGIGVLVGLTLLFQLEWKLTLAMLVGSSLMFLGPRLLHGRAESVNTKYKKKQEQFANLIDENLRGQTTIKNLHLQDLMFRKAEEHIKSLFTFGLRRNATNSLLERLPFTSLMLLNGIMMGFGGYLIFHNQMTIGSFIAFFTLFMSVGQSISNLSYVIPNLIDSQISFKRIDEITALEPAVLDVSDAFQLSQLAQDIRFDHVSFGYTADLKILDRVKVTIPAGSYTAFVGPSGSGKSTAMQLMLRFYDPDEGAILFDQMDLRFISEKSLRALMSIVFQETFLFNMTIRENLLAGMANISDEDMIAATQAARIHETIQKWPDGYDTVIQNDGANLSGGQKQRISIARALIRNPSILLLDEVTSALDPATEAEINESLYDLKRERTVISVTHRLASAVKADQIIVFQEGIIVETGTHEELLQRKGVYAQMWDKQHGFTLSGDGLHARVDGSRLAKLPFFHDVEEEPLNYISTLFTTERFEQGQDIVLEGAEGDKFFIIVRGRVAITKQMDNRSKRVAVLQDGDHFGEIALLQNIPRTATVTAIEPTIVLSLRRDWFLDLTQKYPQIYERVQQSLQERLK